MEQGNFVFESKDPSNMSKQVNMVLHKKTNVDWGKILVSDMNQIIDALQSNPIIYDFTDINEFVQHLNKQNSKVLSQMNQSKYQQILKILSHKANDDHTGIQFTNPFQFEFAGFTAVFDIVESDAQIKVQPTDTAKSQSQSQQVKHKDGLKGKGKGKDKDKSEHQHIVQQITRAHQDFTKIQQLEIRDKGPLQIFKVISDQEIKNMKLIVDIVVDIELMQYLQPGDIITHINNRPALSYLKEVSKYSERNTNAPVYSLQKTALRIGIYNYFFPIDSITVSRPQIPGKQARQSFEIVLKYRKMNHNLRFNNMSFTKYFNTNLQQIRDNEPFLFKMIDPKTAYVKVHVFWEHPQFSRLLKNIKRYKQNSQKMVDLFVIDVRGNNGGLSSCRNDLICHVIDNQLMEFLSYTEYVTSTDDIYLLHQFDEKIASIAGNQNLNVQEKNRQLKTARDLLKLDQYNASIGNTREVTYFSRNNEQSFKSGLLSTIFKIQSEQAIMTTKGERPGIVILTNQICKSSCSIFAKEMTLFPNVIVVGRQVQGYNQSGDMIHFPLRSGIGYLKIPSVYSRRTPDVELFLKESLDPHIWIPINQFPQSHEQTLKWIKSNKESFVQKIQVQCKAFLTKHKIKSDKQ